MASWCRVLGTAHAVPIQPLIGWPQPTRQSTRPLALDRLVNAAAARASVHCSYGLRGLCPLLPKLLSAAGVIVPIVGGRVKTGDQEHAAEGLPVIGIPFHPFHMDLLMSVTRPATAGAVKVSGQPAPGARRPKLRTPLDHGLSTGNYGRH
ncbi:hypothetical protein BDW72DRAFT_85555 [Aspergillus terricola var. indicus]